jgi:hypothetical protein
LATSILVQICENWQQTAKAYSVERYRNHIGQSTYKPLSINHEYIGLLGECDFRIGNLTIDIKTYRRPVNVLCKQHKRHADRIVLAKYVSDEAIKLIGWDYYDMIKRSQPKDFGRGIINHHKEAGELREMKELEQDIQREKHNLCQQQSRYTVHTRS